MTTRNFELRNRTEIVRAQTMGMVRGDVVSEGQAARNAMKASAYRLEPLPSARTYDFLLVGDVHKVRTSAGTRVSLPRVRFLES